MDETPYPSKQALLTHEETSSPLWRDVRHAMLSRRSHNHAAGHTITQWLGCLVYFVRHRPRLPLHAALQLVCPEDAMQSIAIRDDDAWPCSTTTKGVDALRVRTLVVLLIMQHSIPPPSWAVEYVAVRSNHPFLNVAYRALWEYYHQTIVIHDDDEEDRLSVAAAQAGIGSTGGHGMGQ